MLKADARPARRLTAQDSIGSVLGICFRLLGNARNSDSVISTASATVRQVGECPSDCCQAPLHAFSSARAVTQLCWPQYLVLRWTLLIF